MTLQLNPADLAFLFDNVLFGDTPPPGTDPFLSIGIRTIDGSNNNLTSTMTVDQHNNMVHTDSFGLLDQPFFHLTDSVSPLATALGYFNPSQVVMDASPRIVSNLIASDTTDVNDPSYNPAAAAAGVELLNPGDPVNDILPFNSLFTFFGQFFDHGLDFVRKGNDGVVMIPLLATDPLYVQPTPENPNPVNTMFLTRATLDDDGNQINSTAPFIEQSQTYGSTEATSFYLKEYDVNGDATGDLVAGEHGLASWADIKANALQWATAQAIANGGPIPDEMLNDQHILDIPDPTMWDVATGAFLPNAGVGQTFLADIAHTANPEGKVADSDSALGLDNGANPTDGTYDDELLAEHFIAGDPRANENVALSAIHETFHNEHTRIVNQLRDWVQQQDQVQPGFAAQWDGETYFQAAKVVNEMQYQHMVFEEFARRMSPNVDVFSAYDVNINPNIAAEFAHAVYRLGHSMQTDAVLSTNSIGEVVDHTLIDAFLNPVLFGEVGGADFLKGAQQDQGNQIDEFVTDALRNFLVGLPLDLAALNIARGRETGLGSLNQTRAELFAQTGESSLEEYHSWAEFGANLLNPSSLANFIAAYSHDGGIAALRNAGDNAGARAAAEVLMLDSTFMNGGDQGFWDIDLWIGGLAEQKVPLGMLGSTFDFIFAQQMIALQNGDRFYYLERIAGTNILEQIESHTFADIISRGTGAQHLNGDAFGFTDVLIELSSLNNGEDFLKSPAELLDTIHEVIGGTNAVNTIQGGAGNDSIYGEKGNDDLDGGIGDDHIYGGEGDDIIEGSGGFDFLRGDDGADTIRGGSDDDAISGGDGNDTLFGDSGFDAILGNRGDDSIFGGSDDDEILGGEGNDTLHGETGDDLIEGGAGDDVINGGAGDDRLAGIAGNNIFIGGSGADRIDGAIGGFDVSSYETFRDAFASGTVGGLTVDMLDPAVSTGDAANDSLGDIEMIRGSKHDDQLLGDDLNNVLVGGEGDDTLNGRIGDDTLMGGEGNDTVIGGAGIDTAILRGDRADYTFTTGLGGTTIWTDNVGTEGVDTINGDVELLSFDDQLISLATGEQVPLIGLSGTHARMQNGSEVFVDEVEADVNIDDGTALTGAQGVKVADILVTDNDGINGVRTITLAGRDAAAFAVVNGMNGPELRLVGGGPLSFTNHEIQPNYYVAVTVTDASGSSTLNYTLNVEDVNDNAPVITSGNRVNVNENAAAHHVLYRPTSEDADSTGETADYTLTGLDAGAFTLNNGELRFNDVPDFENPLDADGDNVYEITIETDDGINGVVSKAVKVYVKDDPTDAIVGTENADVLEGFSGNEIFYGLGDDDVLRGNGGNDEIHGDGGDDTAVYGGVIGDYDFSLDSNGIVTVIDTRNGSPDGTDTLDSVEFLQFDGNPTLTFTVESQVTNAPVVPDPVDFGAIDEDPVAGFAFSNADLVAGVYDINGDTLTAQDLVASSGTIVPGTPGNWSYVPDLNFNGPVTISFNVSDGNGGLTPHSANINVTPVDDIIVPGATVDLGASNEDTVRVITTAQLVANIDEVDGDTLTVSNIIASSGTLLDNTDGTWDFTPDMDDDTDVSFTYDVSDGTTVVSTAAALELTAVNDEPVPGAPVDLGASDEDAVRVVTSIELLANATDIDGGALSVTNIVSSTGALFDNGDGTWNFTPDLNDDTDVTFTYDIFDGFDSTPTSASLDLTPVNDDPDVGAAVDLGVSDEDTVRAITSAELLVNASDVDGDTLTVENLVASSGALTSTGVGTWDFTPDLNDDTAVTFTFDVSDGAVLISSSASLDLTPINDAPIFDAPLEATANEEDAIFPIDLLFGASDPEGDNINVLGLNVDFGNAAGLSQLGNTLNVNPGAYSSLNPGESEVIGISYQVVDTSGASSTQTATITINGSSVIVGTNGDDTLSGTSGDDIIRGLDGNDIITGLAGQDTIEGGLGSDTAAYAGSAAAVSIDLGAGSASGGDADGDTYVSVENLIGSSHDDTLAGDAGDNVLDGGAGTDTAIFAGLSSSFDFSDNGVGSFLVHGLGMDTLTSIELVQFDETTFNVLSGTSADDTLLGTTGDDLIFGQSGNDYLLDLGGGNDILLGGLDDDQLQGSEGADRNIGGGGTDEVRYNNSDAAVTVNLLSGNSTGGHANGDTFSSIENLVGSQFDDTLTGDGNANRLEGFFGDDTLQGGAGADVLVGDLGFDTADFSDSGTSVDVGLFRIGTGGTSQGDQLIGVEAIIGSNFADTLVGAGAFPIIQLDGGEGNDLLFDYGGTGILNGGGGNDTLIGRLGADVHDGGDGIDVARFASAVGAVDVNLNTGMGTGADAQGDTFVNVENVVGSQFFDTLTGDAGNNRLEGLAGRDTLTGGGGDDMLFGGADLDTFVFTTGDWGNDTIFDFNANPGQEKLDMSALGITFNDLSFVDTAFGMRIDYIDATYGLQTIALGGVDLADITNDDFIF